MLAQKLILSYGSKIVTQFIQIAASIVVARIAGPTVLGTVAFGLAFVSMFEFISDFGIGSAHIKLISEGKDLGKCVSTYSLLKFVTTSLFFVTVLAMFLLQKYLLGVKFESIAHEHVIVITLITVVVRQLLYIPTGTFAAKTEQAKQDIPEFVRTIIYQGLRVLIVLLGFKSVALAFGNLAATLFVVPLILYFFRSYPRGGFDKDLAYKYLRISLPILIIGMSTRMVFYLDRVALQYLTGSEQVGLYTAGYRIGGLVFMIATSVGILFFPTFSKAASTGNFVYIKDIIERFERFTFLFIMPVVIFLSLYSDVIIKVLLGSEYLPSVPVMAIINMAMFLMVMNMPYGNVITAMGFFKLAAILNLSNLLLFIILLFILPNPRVFNLGVSGVAITVFVSNLFIGCMYRFFSKQKCSIIDLKKGVKFIAFGIVNFAFFYLLYTHFSTIYGVSFRLVFALIYFLTTYIVLFLLGWIEKRDLYNLRKLTDIKKIGDYIKGEMKE